MQLSSGGGVKVAESLDGRLVSRSSGDRLERRLLNVVDEMAIASGIPVPKVYVLDNESGINAFAAGTSTSDAVVAVTRGTLEQLNRDELQGVVGHEFSHIFNGDMRLNIRLMGVLHGILMLTLIGRVILRGGSRGHHVRSSSSGRGKGGGGIVVFALALFVIGYIGVFFGRLIKAAVSRQREFLADASAVQFTRNQAGLAGALKKIAGLDATRIHHPDAESASHMFFGNGINNFLSLLATHPPVEERISRLDPYFKMERETSAPSPSTATAQPQPQSEAAMGFSSGVADVTPQTVRASVGNFDQHHLDYAHTLLERLPEPIWKALREPEGAHALVLAIVLAKEKSPKSVLITALPETSPDIVLQTLTAVALLKDIERADWLPLLELAIPTLEELPEEQLAAIPDEVDTLIRADKQVTLFEFSLATLLRHTLIERSSLKQHRHKGGIKQVNSDVSQLLSLMVHAGHKDEKVAREAFDQAVTALGSKGEVSLQSRSELSLKTIEEALERLARLNFRFKGKVIEAATTAIMADAEVKLIELDFLRAIGASLDCPIPPLQVSPVSRSK
jgi:Zn-dependent protease with chaperone function/DNA-binding Xre family transcriptional regulator